jgi:nucleotide-binding universal stress UspA family protein
MYLSLLVPLNRSSFAEEALPLALSIARRAGARLDLVEVHALYALEDPTAGWIPLFEPDRDAEWKQQEQLYLDATATWLTSMSRTSVSTGVLNGSAVISETVADSILERAWAGKADLIVMASHGRGRLSRFATGSVADQLIRRSGVPVLLVRPGDTAHAIFPEPALDNILIPLDGSALAEQVLGPALELARLMEARCTLLRVIEPHSARHNGAPGGPAKEAGAYLERLSARLREQGVPAETRVVVARHVAEAILEQAAAQTSDLIALATHGRGGLARLLRGSVAVRLVRAAASPVLVYRPSREVRSQKSEVGSQRSEVTAEVKHESETASDRSLSRSPVGGCSPGSGCGDALRQPGRSSPSRRVQTLGLGWHLRPCLRIDWGDARPPDGRRVGLVASVPARSSSADSGGLAIQTPVLCSRTRVRTQILKVFFKTDRKRRCVRCCESRFTTGREPLRFSSKGDWRGRGCGCWRSPGEVSWPACANLPSALI